EGAPVGQEVLDHPGTTGGRVVPLPYRAAHELRTVGADLLGEGGVPGQVVRAVHVPAEIGERSVTVVADQVPGQFGHAGPVVAAHVHGARCRHARQGHNGHLVAEPADMLRIEDAVVQDEPVALA